jgi:hypothetical protein
MDYLGISGSSSDFDVNRKMHPPGSLRVWSCERLEGKIIFRNVIAWTNNSK